MNLSNYYYYFESVLPEKFCDDVIKYGLSKQEVLGRTGTYDTPNNLTAKDTKDLKKKRNSNIAWMDDTWIYKEIHTWIYEANKAANWNFQWDFSESCQFTKYIGSKKKHYGWHCDSHDVPYNTPNNPDTHGKIRKLSMTAQLTDPKKYKGGDLQFDFRNEDPDNKERNIVTVKEILPRGSIIVFPSFVWHRVKPVTSGTRYSLVSWQLGRPYN